MKKLLLILYLLCIPNLYASSNLRAIDPQSLMGLIKAKNVRMPIFDRKTDRTEHAILFSGNNIDKWVFQQNIYNFFNFLKKESLQGIEEAISVADCFDRPFNKEPGTYARNLCNGEYTIGLTPLAYAAAFHRTTHVMKILLQNGADPNRIDRYGNTPLEYVYSQEKIALLREYNAQASLKYVKPSEERYKIEILQEDDDQAQENVDQRVIETLPQFVVHPDPYLQNLHTAIEQDDHLRLRNILRNYKPSKSLSEIDNPLVLAVLLEKEKAVKMLINAGFPVSQATVEHALSLENQKLIDILTTAQSS